MAAKREGTTGAFLDLLEVQTALEVSAQAGREISQLESELMAHKVKAARDLLQGSLLAAIRILENGQ